MGSTERIFWRISGYHDLAGIGGKLVSARWHTKGRAILYLADSPAGAMLERLVHIVDADGRTPRGYDLLEIKCPGGLKITNLDPPSRADWKLRETVTRAIGNRWLESRQSPLARVPSAIIPRTWNYLLNPEHPGASKLKIESVIRGRFDNR
jgi:RES domain-containing protein